MMVTCMKDIVQKMKNVGFVRNVLMILKKCLIGKSKNKNYKGEKYAFM